MSRSDPRGHPPHRLRCTGRREHVGKTHARNTAQHATHHAGEHVRNRHPRIVGENIMQAFQHHRRHRRQSAAQAQSKPATRQLPYTPAKPRRGRHRFRQQGKQQASDHIRDKRRHREACTVSRPQRRQPVSCGSTDKAAGKHHQIHQTVSQRVELGAQLLDRGQRNLRRVRRGGRPDRTSLRLDSLNRQRLRFWLTRRRRTDTTGGVHRRGGTVPIRGDTVCVRDTYVPSLMFCHLSLPNNPLQASPAVLTRTAAPYGNPPWYRNHRSRGGTAHPPHTPSRITHCTASVTNTANTTNRCRKRLHACDTGHRCSVTSDGTGRPPSVTTLCRTGRGRTPACCPRRTCTRRYSRSSDHGPC